MRTEPSFSEESENHLSNIGHSNSHLRSGVESDSSLLSDYRQRYGLSVDPFVDDPHFPFYQGAQRRQILEQLLHLCQFSHNLLVVAGEYGVGKTRMAQALIDALDDTDDICFVEGQITSDTNSLLGEILAQFEFSSRDDFTELCKKSEQDGLVVLIVDNAHHLTDEVIADLIELIQENAESRLHLVLFSEPYLLDRLENFNVPGVVLTDFSLEKFSLAEAVDYLNFRMEMADYLGPEIFIETKVEPWWRQAQGQLLLLHEQAQEKLLASVSAPQRSRGYGVYKQSLPVPHIIAASVLISGLFLSYVYFGSDSPKKTVAHLAEPVPVVVQSERVAYNSSQAASEQLHSSVAISSVVSNENQSSAVVRSSTSLSMIASSVAPIEKPESRPAIKQSIVPLAQTNEFHSEGVKKQNQQSVGSSLKNIKKAEVSSESAKVVVSAKSEGSIVEPKIPQGFSAQEKTILGWDASEYTLQLMGLSSEKAAHEFIAAQPNKKDLLLFKSRRLGKDWFVVVTGHFSSSTRARQAGLELPELQKKAAPWPREVKVIQQEIKQHK